MSSFTININAPDLVAALHALAGALQKSTEAPAPTIPPKTESKPTPEEVSEPTISLETVRAKLATLAQGGKQAEVKALIAKFGAKKLTDIAVAKYPELLAAAEGL